MFETIKRLYAINGIAVVNKAVLRGWITQEEADLITG